MSSASSPPAGPPAAGGDVVDLDAILLTASNPSQAAAFRAEVEIRRARGSLPPEEKTRVLVVCDPAGVRIGSGGATLASLHALLRSLPGSPADQLASLLRMRIGMFHSGGDSQRLPTCSVRGKAFCGLPYSDPATPALFESTPLDFLFACLSRLARAPGCIITATDCLFDFPHDYPPILPGSAEAHQGVVGWAIETQAELGSNHGVYVLPPSKETPGKEEQQQQPGIRAVHDIMQKASQSELRAAGAISPSGTVLLDSGIVFLSPSAVAAFLSLVDQSPFQTCLNGPDQEAAMAKTPNEEASASSPSASASAAAASPIPAAPGGASSLQAKEKAFRFELYTDILLPMNPSMSLSDFLASTPPDSAYPKARLAAARTLLWQALHSFTMYCAVAPRGGEAEFFHMGTMDERMEYMYSREARYARLREKHHFVRQAHAVWDTPTGRAPVRCREAAVLNSYFSCPAAADAEEAVLEAGSFVEYSALAGAFHIGAGAVVSGLRSAPIGRDLHLPKGMCLQETRLADQWYETLQQEGDRRAYQACTRLAAASSASSRLSPPSPPTVISVFHIGDAIKTPYSHASATFLGRPFLALVEQIAQATDQPVERLVQLIWPGSTTDRERTLWAAHVHPVHQEATSSDQSPIYPFYTSGSGSSATTGADGHAHIRWLFEFIPAPSGVAAPPPHLCVAWATWLHAPRLSFSNILAYSDVEAENAWRAEVAGRGDAKLLEACLFDDVNGKGESEDATSTTATTAAAGRGASDLFPVLLQRLSTAPVAVRRRVTAMLDQRALWCLREQTKLDVVGRVMWTQAYLLRHATEEPAAAAAATSSSSPSPSDTIVSELTRLLALAQPETWRACLPRIVALLSSLRTSQAVDRLWLADRYDAANGAVGRCAVALSSDTRFAPLGVASQVAVGDTVSLRGCIRLDLFGGWTDTPPVTYEHGGAVVNVAINIDGAYPIRLEAAVMPASEKTPPMRIAFGLPPAEPTTTAATAVETFELTHLSDFADFAEPTAPAALIKCTLLAMGIVDLADTSSSLEQQLTRAFWSGKQGSSDGTASASATATATAGATPIHLQLHSWIALSGNVAQGTGLGISSILAGDLVLLFARVFSRVYTPLAVTFLVLRVEQMLTTCGGWQDQVGGLWDGFKLTRAPRGLPLRLHVEELPVAARLAREFEQHLVFIHTGLPRLAKNLLRTVLDAWASRDPHLVAVFDRLQEGAAGLAGALQAGDWKQVGASLNEYWKSKKILATDQRPGENAPPAEPTHVAELIRRTEKHCYGATLAGAGGGGFLVLFAPPEHHAAISSIVGQFNAERRRTADEASPASSETPAAQWQECRMYQATVCAEPGSCYQISVRKA